MKRILVLCPGPWDEAALARPEVSQGYELVRAATNVWQMPWYRLLLSDPFDYARSIAACHRRGPRIDGVVGTGDYPASQLAALVVAELGLPGPSFESVVRLSHKLLSREIHRRSFPEATPTFEALDPAGRREPSRLAYPFFVKPVKGTMSIRACLVRDRSELDRTLHFEPGERLRKRLLLLPFDRMLRRIGEGRVPAHWFIAEEPLGGAQVTVDGFMQAGRATVMGIVDSVMYPGTMSFSRFEYPSRLPGEVQQWMSALAVRLMEGSGFDDSCFNVEMFWDQATGRISIIEVNPRLSYQFADLYQQVDGTNSFDVQLRLATGEPPGFRRGAGRGGVAASFVMRRFSDARVRAVPSAEALAGVERLSPGARVVLLCAAGERLSDHDQDVGSFRYAIVNLWAPTRTALASAWAEAEARLRFDFKP